MKTIHEIGAAIASVDNMEIVAIQADGDVEFNVDLKNCGLSKEDYKHPMLFKRFFVNYIGELLVRQRISNFATILTGLDPLLYKKLVNTCEHGDFGMFMSKKDSIMIFEMHLSLIQEILTEEFAQLDDLDLQVQGSIDDFDASEKPDDNLDNEDFDDNDDNDDDDYDSI